MFIRKLYFFQKISKNFQKFPKKNSKTQNVLKKCFKTGRAGPGRDFSWFWPGPARDKSDNIEFEASYGPARIGPFRPGLQVCFIGSHHDNFVL